MPKFISDLYYVDVGFGGWLHNCFNDLQMPDKPQYKSFNQFMDTPINKRMHIHSAQAPDMFLSDLADKGLLTTVTVDGVTQKALTHPVVWFNRQPSIAPPDRSKCKKLPVQHIGDVEVQLDHVQLTYNVFFMSSERTTPELLAQAVLHQVSHLSDSNAKTFCSRQTLGNETEDLTVIIDDALLSFDDASIQDKGGRFICLQTVITVNAQIAIIKTDVPKVAMDVEFINGEFVVSSVE